MQIFFVEKVEDSTGWLSGEEARHCLKVLRHREGDKINVVDGIGNKYRATIDEIRRQEVLLKLAEKSPDWGEHPYRITAAVSPLRLKDRYEWFAEKAVELGVTDVVPLQCAHTEVFKAKIKPHRLQQIMLTAMKQCKRSFLPKLHPMIPFDNFIEDHLHDYEGKYIAFCEEERNISEMSEDIRQQQSIVIIIGPEGDFSDEEMRVAKIQGCQPVSLGQNRLRTETAAVHALSLFKGLKGY